MNETKLIRTLPSDIARCHGTQEPVCNDCLRRLQIESDNNDDNDSWYTYISVKPLCGECEYKIDDD